MQMYPSEIDDGALEMHAAILEEKKVGTPKSRTIDQDKMIKNKCITHSKKMEALKIFYNCCK